MITPVGISLRSFVVLASLAAIVPLAIWSLRPIPKIVDLSAAPSRTESTTAEAVPQPTNNSLDLAAFRTPLWYIPPPPPPPPPLQTAAFVPPPRPLAAKLLAIVHNQRDTRADDHAIDHSGSSAAKQTPYRAIFFDPALDQVIEVGVEGVVDGFTVTAIDALGVSLRREEEQQRVLLDPTGVNTPTDPATTTGMLAAPALPGSMPR